MIKAIEDKIIRDIENLFVQEEDYYKTVGLGNFHTNNCIKYETNDDRNKTLSVKEYFIEIKPCFKDINHL